VFHNVRAQDFSELLIAEVVCKAVLLIAFLFVVRSIAR
jgi:hypothetical protein